MSLFPKKWEVVCTCHILEKYFWQQWIRGRGSYLIVKENGNEDEKIKYLTEKEDFRNIKEMA